MSTQILVVRSVLVFAAIGLASCARSSKKNNATGGEPTAAAVPWTAPQSGIVAAMPAVPPPEVPSRHSVQSAQLQSLMKSLSAGTQRNWPRTLPQDPEDPGVKQDDAAMKSAALLADGLADAAAKIPTCAAASKMSDADRAGFAAEANVLHEQAVSLGQSARSRKVEQMQKTLDAIGTTCITCHSRYRDISGQLYATRSKAK